MKLMNLCKCFQNIWRNLENVRIISFCHVQKKLILVRLLFIADKFTGWKVLQNGIFVFLKKIIKLFSYQAKKIYLFKEFWKFANKQSLKNMRFVLKMSILNLKPFMIKSDVRQFGQIFWGDGTAFPANNQLSKENK